MGANATPYNNGNVDLRFPRDVATQDVPNYIVFIPKMVDFGITGGQDSRRNHGSAFNKGTPNATKQSAAAQSSANRGPGISFSNPLSAIRQKIGGFVDSVANNAIAKFTGSFGKVNFNLGTGSLSGRIDLGAFSLNLGGANALAQKPNTVKSLPGINLYLPPELATKLGVKYGQKELGALGQEAITFANGSFNPENFVDSGVGALSGLVQDLVFKNEKIGSAFTVATGRAKNNYTYAIFQGVEHRTFSYKFNLVAKNEDESISIKKICDDFMFYMLPHQSTDNFHFYDVPVMWSIEYKRLGEKIQYIDQPNNCFLTSCNITYGGGTQTHTYENGAPIDVQLSLEFMELEPLMRKDGDRADQPGAAGLMRAVDDLTDKAAGIATDVGNKIVNVVTGS